MSHLKNRSHLETWVTFGKVGHSRKNGAHLEKLVALGKGVTLKKVGHTCKSA